MVELKTAPRRSRPSACLRQAVEGVAVIQVVNWSKHQNPHMKEQASTLPEMTMPDASMVLAPYKQQPTTEVAGLIPDSGFPSSEAKASGAEAPPKTRDELWAAGKSLLVSQGMPKAQCGTFVGKLVKDYGDEVVVDAVRSAVVQRPADAASYLKATCQSLAGERVGTAKERADAERVNEAASAQIDATQAYLAKLDAHKPSPPPASLRKVHG